LIEPERLPTDAPLFKVSKHPVIKTNSESPPSDMSQYFTKEEAEQEVNPNIEITNIIDEVKPEKTTAFSSLLEQINAKRNDKDVVGSSPIIENSTPTVEVQPVENIEAVQETKTQDPAISSLLKDINSRRLEYGTPNITTVGLPRPELSPINLNPASSSALPDIDNTGIDVSDESPQENIPSVN